MEEYTMDKYESLILCANAQNRSNHLRTAFRQMVVGVEQSGTGPTKA